MTYSLEEVLPNKRAVRRSFDRAQGFDRACFVHDETRGRLLERLDWLKLAPAVVVDLGCATGRAAEALAARYPAATVLAVDSSLSMLRAASERAGPSVAVFGGDAERLPLPSQRADLIFANLVLASCRPAARSPRPTTAFMFTPPSICTTSVTCWCKPALPTR